MKVCLLEQSGLPPDELSDARRFACEKLGWGYRRLAWNPETWKVESDTALRVHQTTWSDGRSLLYQSARGFGFEYFLFIDDDIMLSPRTNSTAQHLTRISDPTRDFTESLELLHEVFSELKPASGNIFSETDWAHAWSSSPSMLGLDLKCFPIACHDLQTHFFHREIADLVFPAPVSGSGGSMWYAQFAGHVGWQSSQVCISNVQAINTRHLPHKDQELEHFHTIFEIHNQLSKVINHPEWPHWNYSDLAFPGGFGMSLNREAALLKSVHVDPESARKIWSQVFDRHLMESLRTRLAKRF